MIQNERDCRHEHVLDVARQMLTAARTAPKGKGIDVIEAALVTGEDIKKLSEKMVAMVEEHGMKFFLRDADNILQAECVIIIGTREQAQGLNCGHCGFPTCAGRPEGVPCALNTVDVGLGLCHGCRFEGGYPCHVFCRTCRPAFGLAERMQDCFCHSGECILQESVLRPETEGR